MSTRTSLSQSSCQCQSWRCSAHQWNERAIKALCLLKGRRIGLGTIGWTDTTPSITLPPGTVPGDNKLMNILFKRIMPFDGPPFRFFFDFGSGLRVRGACSWNLKSSAGSLKYLSDTDCEESQRSCQICIAHLSVSLLLLFFFLFVCFK
jgi:hypothetical protein